MTAARNIWPISFTEDNVRAIRVLSKIETRRPAGRLGNCRPGDLLWIREPFHLSAKLDGQAPLQALAHGFAIARFAADWHGGMASPSVLDPTVGKRRNARELPKALHRYHLIVHNSRREALHAIDDAGARAEGCADRHAYAALWDTIHPGGKTMKGTPVRWSDNPTVDVLSFDFVPAPVPSLNPANEGDRR
jgi:hypothetical protein